MCNGESLIDFVHTRVVTPEMWVSRTELFEGQSVPGHPSREPFYDAPSAYGGFSMENLIGVGSLVGSAAPLLELMHRYNCRYRDAGFGRPLNGAVIDGGHSGILDGTNARIEQETSGVHLVALFNKRAPGNQESHGHAMTKLLLPIIRDNPIIWPEQSVDGFWVGPDHHPSHGFGGFDVPFEDLGDAAAQVEDGAKLRMHPGASAWTGVLDKKLLIDAPHGTAVIGAAP